jgi:hypothetical protein
MVMGGCKTYSEYVAQAKAQNEAIKSTLWHLSVEGLEVDSKDRMLARGTSAQRMLTMGLAAVGGLMAAALSGASFSGPTRRVFVLIAGLPVINIGAREDWFQDDVSRYLTLKYAQLSRKST